MTLKTNFYTIRHNTDTIRFMQNKSNKILTKLREGGMISLEQFSKLTCYNSIISILRPIQGLQTYIVLGTYYIINRWPTESLSTLEKKYCFVHDVASVISVFFSQNVCMSKNVAHVWWKEDNTSV